MTTPLKLSGRVSLARALHFTTGVTHVSSHARTKQPGFLWFHKKLLPNLQTLVENVSRNNPTHSRLPAWRRMLEVGKKLEGYIGRRPSYAQAFAALALHMGETHSQLGDYANALHFLNARASALGKPILSDINYSKNKRALLNLPKVLAELRSRSVPSTTKELVKATGFKPAHLHSTLLILEAAGAAIMLQKEDLSGGRSAYRWTAFEHRQNPSTKPIHSVAYQIMKELYEGPKSQSELAKMPILPGGNGKLPRQAVRSQVNLLEMQGVLKSEKTRVERGRSPQRITVYGLTNLGQELFKRQEELGYAYAPLRRVLLGAPTEALTPRETHKLDTMIKYIKVRQDYESVTLTKRARRGTIPAIAQRHGLTPISAIRISRLVRPPWSKLSYQTLEQLYLPAMRRIAGFQAGWFAEYLEKHAKEFPARKGAVRKLKFPVSPEELFEQHRWLAIVIAREFWRNFGRHFANLKMDWPDAQQEAMAVLHEATTSFDKKRGIPFKTYVNRIIRNRLNSIVTSSRRKKRTEKSVSIEAVPEIQKTRRPTTEDLKKILFNALHSIPLPQEELQAFDELYGLSSGKAARRMEVAEKYGFNPRKLSRLEEKILALLGATPEIRELE